MLKFVSDCQLSGWHDHVDLFADCNRPAGSCEVSARRLVLDAGRMDTTDHTAAD